MIISDNSIKYLDYGKYITHNIVYHIPFENFGNIKLTSLSTNSYIQGQSFDKKEDVKYNNITYIIEDMLGNNIKEYNSTDGSFIIDGLNDGEPVNLIVVDNNNTYNGKYIKNLVPSIDYQKAMKIIQIYSNSNEAMYKIKFHGEPTLTLTGSGVLNKMDDNYYKVTNITGDITLTLVDYIDNNAYLLEKTYLKGDNYLILKDILTKNGGV